MSRSTLYRRLRTLRCRLAIVDTRLDSIDPAWFNASVALTDGLTLRGRLVREIQSLRDRLKSPATTNP